MSDKCGVVNASCACILPPDHTGPHACDCGGVIGDKGDVYALPRQQGLLTQAQAIEHQAACVKRGTMNLFGVLAALLGPFDDEDETGVCP